MRRQSSLLCLLLLTAACGEESPGAGASQAESSVEAVRVSYPMRGLVRGVENFELTVHHEPVPDLVGPGGSVEPMGEMTMSFPLAAGVDLAGLAAGDKVAFTLAIDWNAPAPAVVTDLAKLAPDTRLTFD